MKDNTGESKTVRQVIYVPSDETDVLDWLDAQSNKSQSLRMAIRYAMGVFGDKDIMSAVFHKMGVEGTTDVLPVAPTAQPAVESVVATTQTIVTPDMSPTVQPIQVVAPEVSPQPVAKSTPTPRPSSSSNASHQTWKDRL